MRSFDFRSRSAVAYLLTFEMISKRFSGLLPFTATFRVNERLCNMLVTEIIYYILLNSDKLYGFLRILYI